MSMYLSGTYALPNSLMKNLLILKIEVFAQNYLQRILLLIEQLLISLTNLDMGVVCFYNRHMFWEYLQMFEDC
jgi:hypothetical protein